MSLRGLCNQPVIVLTPVITFDDARTPILSYREEKTVLAHVSALSTIEQAQLKQLAIEVDYEFWFAEDPEVSEKQRLEWKGLFLRPQPSVDFHSLGRVYNLKAKLLTADHGEIRKVS